MTVNTYIDFEYEVKKALEEHLTAYVRPLPKEFILPNILIHQVGGNTDSEVDYADIVLDARALTDAEANEYMRKAIGVIRDAIKNQTTELRHIEFNSAGAWGSDPVRPDLSLFSARIRIYAHQTTMEV